MSAFNPTTKTQEALQQALQTASSNGNPDIRPAHLLAAILSPDSLRRDLGDRSLLARPILGVECAGFVHDIKPLQRGARTSFPSTLRSSRSSCRRCSR